MKDRKPTVITTLMIIVGATALIVVGVINPKHPAASPYSTISPQGNHSAPSPGKDAPPNHNRGTEAPYDNGVDLVPMTTTEVAKLSKWIVLVKAQSTKARRLPNTMIFTFSEFEVLESFKGAYPDKTLTLRTIGGKVGDVELTRLVAFDFIPNQKYILFLGEKNALGYPTIEPKTIFTVRTDSSTSLDYVSPTPPGIRLLEARTQRPYESNPVAVKLEDFVFSLKKLNE